MNNGLFPVKSNNVYRLIGDLFKLARAKSGENT